jgi:hypothetical protein
LADRSRNDAANQFYRELGCQDHDPFRKTTMHLYKLHLDAPVFNPLLLGIVLNSSGAAVELNVQV